MNTTQPPHSGGLISYGYDPNDQYRRAAIHVDRILKGEAHDLPVQQSTKLEIGHQSKEPCCAAVDSAGRDPMHPPACITLSKRHRGAGQRRGVARAQQPPMPLIGYSTPAPLRHGKDTWRRSAKGSVRPALFKPFAKPASIPGKAYVGVMAQEVQSVLPRAVVRGDDGYLRVFYDMVGVKFETYDQWVASGGHVPAGTTSAAPAWRLNSGCVPAGVCLKD
jgi:hypothetical protein